MLEVVAALIVGGDSRFLLCQRPFSKARGGLWEFVGGKVEPGETRAQALCRECREELGIETAVDGEVITVTHEYPDLTVRLTLLRARIVSGAITLIEHQAAKWVNVCEAQGMELCPADREMLALIADRI